MKQQPMQQVMPRRGCGIGLGFGDVVESLRRGGIFTRGLRRNLIEDFGLLVRGILARVSIGTSAGEADLIEPDSTPRGCGAVSGISG